jgi:hypothetical protein
MIYNITFKKKMKTLINIQQRALLLLFVLAVTGITACKKDGSEGGKGSPTISRVRTISKSYIDSKLTTTITTYDANGKATSVTSPNTTPQVVAMDSTTTDGNLQMMYAIIGTNLASVTTVSFNGVSVYFNKALGSDSTILVSIPKTTPAGPTQSNILSVTTLYGKVDYKFSILLPAPTVTDVSNYNFSNGSEITLTGIGLASVTDVQLGASSAKATILTKSDTELTIKMPGTTLTSTTLMLTYPSGQVAPKQVYVNLDQAYKIFTEDYGTNWSGNFWGSGEVSSGTAKSGVKSLKLNYAKGGWSANGVANWNVGLPGTGGYTYLSFYIKGGSQDYTLYIIGDKRTGGYGNSDQSAPITVKASVWNYYKIPLSTLGLWATGSPSNTLGFWIKGPDAQDESFYIDDWILVK